MTDTDNENFIIATNEECKDMKISAILFEV